jgi:hypothetical protein
MLGPLRDPPIMGVMNISAGTSRRSTLSRRSRWALAALELFIGVGAVYGGVELLTDADGFGLKEAWLDGSPFPDYTIPGVFLLVVIGGGMIAAAVLTLGGSRLAAPAAIGMGVIVLAFLVVETMVIGYHGATQLPLLVTTALPALALIVLGARLRRRRAS